MVDLATGRTKTYRELREEAYRVATAFRERGLEAGDRVAICMANRPEHVVTFLATQLAGLVDVPFNYRVAPGGARYHLADSGADLVVFDEVSEDAVAFAVDDLGVDAAYVGADPPAVAEPYEDLLSAPADRPEVSIDYDDPSVLLYSSGTTGDPKGIPLTHEITTARHLLNSLGQHYYLGETMVGVMPLYHTVGLHGVLNCLLGMSGTYLCMPSLDPETYARAIGEHGVTAMHEAPTVFVQLLKTDAIDEVDVSSVRIIGFSGAPMSRTTFDALVDRFDPDHIANLYGTTEAYGTLAYVDLQDIADPMVAGHANVFNEVRIVEAGSHDPAARVDANVEGELILNTDSPVSFTGYWNKPERTAEAIHDGWFFTGDAAKRTEEGHVVVTGRVDDMIISGGENIHPPEVEDVLVGHPAVDDVGVVGIDDEEWGEIVKAYVVPNGDVAPDDLDGWCLGSDDLADFKRPREYEFVGELPRNPSGKVMRHKLR